MRVISVLVGVVSFAVAAAVAAHHSFSAEFDISRTLKLTGSVTKVEWTNPHAWVFIDVKDDAGGVEAWAIELIGANGLLRRGWARDTVKVGDVITVEGFGARDGSNTGNASAVITTAGKRIYESATDEAN